ncbi:hypothetical protein PIB30_049406 [Stylosanthes scabra]|uniref:DNA damage-binding protein 1 n=1 Tax=Stylosanthes scabra TaxID=79078 RepID=A0ABU6YJS9_9FABA|nr:hypothetical protein [Stylosanthes scabra]
MAVSEEECSSAKPGPSSYPSTKPYYLSKCVLRGSAVLQVLYAHIRSPSSNDVVFGKETSIELVFIGEDGIVQSVCDQPVFGIIKDLAILPWNAKLTWDPQMWGKDLLIALSDSGKLSFLTFCNEMHRFFPVTHVQLSSPGNTRDLPGRMLAVDSSGCFVAASAYEDRLALFSVSGIGSDIIDERIMYPSESEGTASISTSNHRSTLSGTIWSMCFISQDSRQANKEHNPILAVVLNRRGKLHNDLLLLEWNIKACTISVISQFVEAEAGPLAHNIVEVPNSHGLAFLFRAGDALLMDLRDACNPCCVYRTNLNFLPNAMEEQTYVEDSCKLQDVDDERFNAAACALLELRDYDPMCIDNDNAGTNPSYKYVCSWSWEPENNKDPRMILSVNTGEFFMIEILYESDGLKVSISECLYKGLPCKELLWVKGGYIAALIEMGDGMVLKLEDGRLCYANPIQNITPILDMAVLDYHDEKHDQVFACSGVAPEGSLRIIRSGISTRILSVGLSFTDVTDSVGFQPNVCTLACGLFSDGLLVQIHKSTVMLCLPTKGAHAEGISMSSPICTSWSPDNVTINLGAVGHNFIVVSTSNPCFLFILGVRLLSAYHYEIYELHHLGLQNELSCISIPRQKTEQKQPNSSSSANNRSTSSLVSGVDINKTFVIGTHKPSVEVLSCAPDGVTVVACGTISLTDTMGTTLSGCVPEAVQLVFVDKYYVLAGLRNGMLLRFEWPTRSSSLPLTVVNTACSTNLVNSVPNAFDRRNDLPSVLQLIAIRRIGPSTHVTPVCSVEFPKGILFVAENSLHLVEMVHSKRLNAQKFPLEGTLRKILYHNESRMLLVLRTELNYGTCSSDICFVDPTSGSVLSSFRLEPGETGKSMEIVRVGSEQALGTVTLTTFARGRLLVLCLDHVQNSDSGSMTLCSKAGSSSLRTSPFHEIVAYAPEQLSGSSLGSSPDGIKLDENKVWQFRLAYTNTWQGMVLAICPYLDRYFLASAGNTFYVCGFPNDNPQRVRKFAQGRTRFLVTSLTVHFTRIAVGDCRDGVLFYSYHEGSYSYRLPADDALQGGNRPKTNIDSLQNTIIASTLLGSMMIFIPLSREEYELLEAVQARLAVHHLTAPILGNDNNEFRSRENPVGAPKILDNDMLTQFLELTSMQQQVILSTEPPEMVKSSLKSLLPPHVPVNQGKLLWSPSNAVMEFGSELHRHDSRALIAVFSEG